jgi:bifunctional non-homologous end joining protein LigD
MPGFIKPQLATLKSKAPKGEQWSHEIKFDGYRIQVHINRGRKRVFTRNGLDWTKRFSTIAGALDIPGEAIIDGEVVVVHEGRTNFSELQAELEAGRQDRLVYYAFDLLWRDGDLRNLPQIERKQALLDLLGENAVELPVLYSEHLTGDGQKMFEHAAELNWEGIVSKNAGAPYRSGRNEAWLKVKCVQKGKFPVIGFIKDPTGVAPLYLGRRKARIWSTWARSERDGPARSQAKSGSTSILSSAPNPNLPSRSGSPRPHGSSQPSSLRRIPRHHFGRSSAGEFV